MNQCGEIDRFSAEVNITRFKFGNIEKVAHEIHEALAVGLNPSKPFCLLPRHAPEHPRNHDLRNPHDIHQRRPKIVSDHRGEVRLQFVRPFQFDVLVSAVSS